MSYHWSRHLVCEECGRKSEGEAPPGPYSEIETQAKRLGWQCSWVGEKPDFERPNFLCPSCGQAKEYIGKFALVRGMFTGAAYIGQIVSVEKTSTPFVVKGPGIGQKRYAREDIHLLPEDYPLPPWVKAWFGRETK